MASDVPIKVPQKNITSKDLVSFSGGTNLLGEQNAKEDQIVASLNTKITPDGFLSEVDSLQKWLPDTVGTVYEVFPALYNGITTNYVADNGKIRWCVEGDDTWTDCGGDNTVTTTGVKNMFVRVLDVLLILNGVDKLGYVDLKTKNIIKYTAVADPTQAPTAALTTLTTGTYKIYYGWTYSTKTGETKLSPILTQSINKPRSSWKSDGSEYITLTRGDSPAGPPAGANNWNMYIALAASGTSIQPTDMLLLLGGLDLNQTGVVDNGQLAIDIGRGNPPTDNSTDGMRCKYGIETNGRPILFGDSDHPENLWIGGDGDYALDFSASHGGFRSTPSKGTNFYPASVIGFRNGQGIPSLTLWFTNTKGSSKQATLEQKTINYGNQSFIVWGVTEQNYGAAGIASTYGAVNYNGALIAPTTDGMVSLDSQPDLQNVIIPQRVAEDFAPFFASVNTSALGEIVGTALANNLYFIVPSYGFPTPNRIAIRDQKNQGGWYTMEIAAQWIGTVAPKNSPAFVYICQGNKILKLIDLAGTVNYRGNGSETFVSSARGAIVGFNEGHSAYKALVQAVFYIVGLVGGITIGVNYRDENGKFKTKKKKIQGPVYVESSAGGWSDSQYVYNGVNTPASWSAVAQISMGPTSLQSLTKFHVLPMNVLANEVQWWYETDGGFCSYLFRTVSYQGENQGVKPGLR